MVSRSRTDFTSPSLAFSRFFSSFSSHERIALISLGCARNLVDSEIILGQIKRSGARIVDVSKADTVIVNTCAFVIDAKKETIDTLHDLIALKKKNKIKRIIALGCFAKRYADIFQKEFPEIDQVFGIVPLLKDKNLPRDFLTPSWYAYVKICESCYNHCSFCAIPGIKGAFSSRHIEPILKEVKTLEARGVKEINIIGQDITAYGFDLARPKTLEDLLKKILTQSRYIHWLRLLYMFPKHISEDLLDLIGHEKRICQYMDVPLQHISDKILTSMNRQFNQAQTRSLIEKIRQKIPQCSLRTAFIVGYPQETDKEFKELCQFVKDVQFNHVGVFEYSKEEGTRAAQIKNQIPGRIKRERYNTLMKIQQPISARKLQRFVGQTIEVLLDEKKEENLFVGRSQYDAPEVDGVVYVRSKKLLKLGDFVQARVIDSLEYDLVAQA
jgi:ribosomal protein S12 methylthiotransferase